MNVTQEQIQEAKQTLKDCIKMKEAAIQQADEGKVNKLNIRIKMLEALISGDDETYYKCQRSLSMIRDSERLQSSDDPYAGLNCRIVSW